MTITALKTATGEGFHTPKTAKPPWLSTRAARSIKRFLSLSIYVKRLIRVNREYRAHRPASVCWEEKQLSEFVPPFVAVHMDLATFVPARLWVAERPGTI
jgi:hypothetical protein